MEYTLLAIADRLIWSFWHITKKQISAYMPPSHATGLHLYFIPLGSLGILVSYLINPTPITNVPIQYFGYTFIFAFVVYLQMLSSFYVYSKINLSSAYKFRSGLTIIFAALIDILFFGTQLSIISISGGLLLVSSGFLLNIENKKSDLSLKTFGIIILLVSMVILDAFLFKKIVLLSTNDFLSIFFIQTITQLFVGLTAIQHLKSIHKNPKLKRKKYLYSILIFFGVITEYFLYKELPLFIIFALTNLSFIIYLIFDIWNKELKISLKQVTAVCIGFIGIILLMYR